MKPEVRALTDHVIVCLDPLPEKEGSLYVVNKARIGVCLTGTVIRDPRPYSANPDEWLTTLRVAILPNATLTREYEAHFSVGESLKPELCASVHLDNVIGYWPPPRVKKESKGVERSQEES